MTHILLQVGLMALLAGDAAQASAVGVRQAPAAVELDAGDQIELVADEKTTIRGRLEGLTADAIFVDTLAGRERVPLSTVQQITRLGDSPFNGSLLGAAVGAAASIALVYQICSNTQCADTSSNLDPRLILLGTAIGTGIGALIDGAATARTVVYRAGTGQLLSILDRASRERYPAMVLARAGWARLTNDEGSLGHGRGVGIGITVPLRARTALLLEYARHTRRRQLEFEGGFSGTEQLVTAKTIFHFLRSERVRPYAGLGLGIIDSVRRSELPLSPGGQPGAGLVVFNRHHTRGWALGFAAGAEARLTSRWRLLGDLTADFGNPDALASTRLTIGVGWRF
jgi:hypothetical protein